MPVHATSEILMHYYCMSIWVIERWSIRSDLDILVKLFHQVFWSNPNVSIPSHLLKPVMIKLRESARDSSQPILVDESHCVPSREGLNDAFPTIGFDSSILGSLGD